MTAGMNWDDLHVFLTLARTGKLTAVAKQLDVSHPTVARRVKTLEESVGTRLFDRLPDRYVLTAAGEALMSDAEAMERAADSINRRRAGLIDDTSHGTVRISANEAMTSFLACHLTTLRTNLQCVEFELSASHMLANLSRREADLLIREQVPDLPSLVTRRLGRVAFAIYCSTGFPRFNPTRDKLRQMPWCSFDEDHNYMPGQSWLLELLQGKRAAIRVNEWLVLHECARRGAGLAILPCYMGDSDLDLRRVGPVLKDVWADQFLLVHRDLRELSRVRHVIDAIADLFKAQKALLEGRSAARAAA